jgi:O-succinylbenzoate synthase
MHIDSVSLYRVPLTEATSASGVRLESIFVELRSGQSFGCGEVCLNVSPTDCDEWSAGAFACLRDWLAPAIVGQSIDSGQALQDRLAAFQGNQRAKSALDVAWWVLDAAVREVPLHQLLGGTRSVIPQSCTFGAMDSPERLLAKIGEAFRDGYEWVILKFRPGWDINMLRAVRQAFPAEAIAIDCDGLCTLDQQETFYRLEDFFLRAIEQPLAADDLVGSAMLQSSLHTPLALDQSVTSLDRVEQAIDLGSCQMVRIDIGRVGGLTPALAIRDVCQQAKIQWVVGGGSCSGIAASANAALAACSELPLPLEAYSWSSRPWLMSDDTTLREFSADGRAEIYLPDDAPGFGFLLDHDMLGGHAVERATIREKNAV